MKAMVLRAPCEPLHLEDWINPEPGDDQIRVKVTACGVCRTDLHIVDGELDQPALPLIPGHEVVGVVDKVGASVRSLAPGQRVGIPWLGYTCGRCVYCDHNQENLCNAPEFTGYTINGGYAEYAVADARYCFPLGGSYTDQDAAPLLCAGLIGYRSFRFVGNAEKIGLYGFGAAAHILCQIAVGLGRRVFAFTRPGDSQAQSFARTIGAEWAGASGETPPVLLDASIIFAPVGELVPLALGQVRKGGVVVCGGIHMSAIPSFSYTLLWEERQLRSVANLTRQDANEFIEIATKRPIEVSTAAYSLQDANVALNDLRSGTLSGAAVLVP